MCSREQLVKGKSTLLSSPLISTTQISTQSDQLSESDLKSNSNLGSDLKIINNVIQKMPSWDQKYELGDIQAQETVSETQLFKNMRKISAIIRRLSKYKSENSTNHSTYIKIIRPKIFQLYDMLIDAPSDIKVSNYSPSLENIITQHLIDKNQIPEVLTNIINEAIDPFDLILYNQGDSKSRFNLAVTYFKNNKLNPDFILELSLDISIIAANTNEVELSIMDLLTYYLGLNNGNNVVPDRKTFNAQLERLEAWYGSYLSDTDQQTLQQYDDEAKVFSNLVGDTTKLAQLIEMRETKIQTLLERTIYFIFLLNGDVRITNKSIILSTLAISFYEGCMLNCIYGRRETIGVGNQYVPSRLETERTYILFNVFAQNGLYMGEIASSDRMYGTLLALPIYCNQMWVYLPLAIKYEIDNGESESVNLIADTMIHEYFMKHDHNAEDHIQMLKDIRVLLEDFI